MHGVKLQWEREYAEAPPEREFSVDAAIMPAPSYDGVERFLNLERSALPEPEESDMLIHGDALAVGRYLLRQGYGGRFRMFYLDPPYFTNQKFNSSYRREESELNMPAFDDRWQQSLDRYLEMLYQRLLVMRELLMDNGSIFVHLDWHSSHYGRVLLDEIFGADAFVNELVWCYAGGSNTRRHFQRKHDLIFWYAKAPDHYFAPQYRPYSQGTLERGLTAVKGDRYRLREQGALMQDWWSDVPKILSPTARENMKYPTQKPRLLLQRLIAAASAPGELVGDFFAGAATTADACAALGRRWITADMGALAIQTGLYRLANQRQRPFLVLRADDYIDEGIDGLHIDCEYRLHEHLLSLNIRLQSPDGVNLQECIDLWEIDYDYDGAVFRSRLQIIRQQGRYKGELPLAAELVLLVEDAGSRPTLAVRVYDFSCRRTQRVFQE